MSDIVVFGTGHAAELADFYFTHDSDHRVVAFTVDGDHLREPQFLDKPVVPFGEIAKSYPPGSVRVFVAVGYAKLNAIRAAKVAQAKAMSYDLVSYLSSRATVFPGFVLEENCFILEDNTIQPFVRIGSNVTLWSGNHIGHHSVIEPDVFIASHAVISSRVSIGRGSFVGVNVTIRDGVTIGERCVLGAGALVLESQPDHSVIAPRGSERSAAPSTRLRSI